MTGGWMTLMTRTRRQAHRQPQVEAAPQAVLPLKARWEEGIRFLKRSRLKQNGNPLYALPWHLMLGMPGSGKTTALRRARLTSFAEPNGAAGVSPTDNLEWSFFEQAVVLDTAGRYTDPQNSKTNEDEWHNLLDLLLKVRPREPLNGLTIVLSSDQLTGGSPESLENAGKTLRKRINELMAMVGYKFPIYLLISKCDMIPGMTDFCRHFSSQGLAQAMGCQNDNRSSDASVLLENAFSILTARLKSLRLMLIGQSADAKIDPAVLQLPDAFAGLQKGLASVLQTSFAENHYHETPLLRGIYFAGECQTGEGAATELTGLFLHEFFSKILPADRSSFVPTRRALRWRRGIMSLAAISWFVLTFAVGGLMSYSFLQNMKALNVFREARQEYSGIGASTEDFSAKVLSMDRFAQTLLTLDQSLGKSWLLNFGLRDPAGAELAFKRLISAQFRLEILGPMDDQYRETMTGMTASSSDDRFSRYVAHLVDRLGVLRERLSGRSRLDFHKAPPSLPYLRIAGHEVDDDLKEKVAKLYVDSTFWMANTTALNQEKDFLQAELKHLLMLKGRDPQWLIAWAAIQQSIPPVTLSDEWGAQPGGSREPSVPGLFSRAGKERIDAFFKEVDAALNDPAVSTDLKSRFDQWYDQNAFERWHQFLVAYPQGMETLGGLDHWRTAAGTMASEDNPYARLCAHILQEFSPVAEADLPPWVKHVRQIRGLLSTPAFWKYRQALEKLSKAVSDPSQVMATTAQAFDRTAAPEASPVAIAFNALAKLKAGAPKDLSGDPAVWKLISGPLDFLWEAARRQTADRLQAEWQANVLAQATGLDAAQGLPVLLSKDGPAMRFAKETAAPFVEWRPVSGFGSKEAYQGSIPFTPSFFSFLNGAVWMSGVNNLQVGVAASTPETNHGALRIPHVMKLSLQCAGKKQTLANRRLRVLESTFNTVEQTFSWTPACGETVIEMDLAGNHLVKTYSGAYGFFAFLHDFQSGKHAFGRAEFPEQVKALEDLKVTSITAHYRLKGAPDFAAPKAAPAKIVRN